MTFFAHRYYAKEVKHVFFKEMEEEQERVFKNAFIGECINIQDDPDSSIGGSASGMPMSSRVTEFDMPTAITVQGKNYPPSSKGWIERDAYRKKKLHKDPLKEESILQLHSKRLNVLDECRALKIAAGSYLPNSGKLGKKYKNNGDFKKPNAAFGMFRKTASTFFSSESYPKYTLDIERAHLGDQHLFESEMQREHWSKVNCIHYILAPFLILCAGLCSVAMFTYDDNFARAVFVIIICGYLLDCFCFRLLYILIFTTYKYIKAKRHGYFYSKDVYSESEVDVALKVQKLLEAKKLKRKQKESGLSKQNDIHSDHSIEVEKVGEELREIKEEEEPEESAESNKHQPSLYVNGILGEGKSNLEFTKENNNTNKSPRKKKKSNIKNPKRSGKSRKVNNYKSPKADKTSKQSSSPKKGNTKSPKFKKNKKNKVKNTRSLIDISGFDNMTNDEQLMIDQKSKNYNEPIFNSFEENENKDSQSIKDKTSANALPVMDEKEIEIKKKQNGAKEKSPKNKLTFKNPKSTKQPISPRSVKDSKDKKFYALHTTKTGQNFFKPNVGLDLDSSETSYNGRKKVVKKGKASPSVHNQFRKNLKTKAKGDKSDSLTRDYKSRNDESFPVRLPDLEYTQREDQPPMETEEGLLSVDDIETGLQTQRKLFVNVKEEEKEDSDIESTSDIEYPPTCLKPIEEETDVRVLEKNHPNVLEDIQEHTLFLLRAIFDAYDEKGDKIVKYFRKSRVPKALQVKSIRLVEGPEELFPEHKESQSVVLDPNKDMTLENGVTVLEGHNQDLSILKDSPDQSMEKGMDDPEAEMQKLAKRKRVNKFGEPISGSESDGDFENLEALETDRQMIGDTDHPNVQNGIFGFYSMGEQSEYTHHTPEPVEDVSVDFDKGDGMNKPLVVNGSDISQKEEGDVIFYDKEDMTNYSKGLGLNIVQPRPFPITELSEIESESPRSTKKSKKNKSPKKGKGSNKNQSLMSSPKWNQVSGIYGSEPENSRLSRSKAFGYPYKSPKNKKKQEDSIGAHSNINFGKNLNFQSMNEESKRFETVEHLNPLMTKKPKKKHKKRNKTVNRAQLDENRRRFGGLEINARPIKEQAFLARKRARSRIARKFENYSFVLDYESPYAEYLPALYKEWMPKEPKKDSNVHNMNTSKMGEKLEELSQAYKHEPQPQSINASAMGSRMSPYDPNRRTKGDKMLPVAGEFSVLNHRPTKSLSTQSLFRKNNKRQSRSNSKNRDRRQVRKPIVLDHYDESLDLGSDHNGLIKFNKQKETDTIQKAETTKRPFGDTSAIHSERGPQIVPPGMDIEDPSEGDIVRPLFKNTFDHPNAPPQKEDRPTSNEKRMGNTDTMDFPKDNFMLEDQLKESELSSQVAELMNADQDHNEGDTKDKKDVRINTLFDFGHN